MRQCKIKGSLSLPLFSQFLKPESLSKCHQWAGEGSFALPRWKLWVAQKKAFLGCVQQAEVFLSLCFFPVQPTLLMGKKWPPLWGHNAVCQRRWYWRETEWGRGVFSTSHNLFVWANHSFALIAITALRLIFRTNHYTSLASLLGEGLVLGHGGTGCRAI